jgi:predicted RNA binding protein YcfA (HicA-like mRNA interferase family)
MGRLEDLIEAAKTAPANVSLSDLIKIIEGIGYVFARQGGSHKIYKRANSPMINIQVAKDGKAKPYQVRQVLDIIEAGAAKGAK